ncbi:hypothetical protein BGZ60DRAFT_533728 [Tricladium varicosporioides]|nr:hypothetical protein BGZ60DRAFT_533728 [Hymenoscyphus varicosporioides]
MALHQPVSRNLGYYALANVKPEILETFKSMAVKSQPRLSASSATASTSSPASETREKESKNTEITFLTEFRESGVAKHTCHSIYKSPRSLTESERASSIVEARKTAVGTTKSSQGLGSSRWATPAPMPGCPKPQDTNPATLILSSSPHVQKSPIRSSAVTSDLLTAMELMAVKSSPKTSSDVSRPVFSTKIVAPDSSSGSGLSKPRSNGSRSGFTQGNPFTQHPVTLLTINAPNIVYNACVAPSPFTPKSTNLSPAPLRGLGASKWVTSPLNSADHSQPSVLGISPSDRVPPEPVPAYPRPLFSPGSAGKPASQQPLFLPHVPKSHPIECPTIPKIRGANPSRNGSPLVVSSERPDTSDLVARRLIGRDLGIKIPKRTDEKTKAVDNSIRMKRKNERMANYDKWRNGNGNRKGET